jgi:hypothetical protein
MPRSTSSIKSPSATGSKGSGGNQKEAHNSLVDSLKNRWNKPSKLAEPQKPESPFKAYK